MPLLESVSGKTDVLDLQDVFRRFSFDCICKFSFGLDPKCLEASLPLSEFAVAEKELRRAIRAVNVLALEVIRQKRKLGISNPQKDDLLSRFMNCTNGVSVDEGFLQDIVVNFLLAGRDTVASGLTGFFRLLARHPEAEARILHEADEVIGPGRGPDCYGRMRDLHYLHAAVHESMRLYPPVQFDSKFCLDDDFLPDGSFVKKGSRVTYHPYAMGRSEEVNPFKYPVFQAGLRVCLGKEMAIEEMKCVAVSLLREYHVELVGFQGPARFSPGLTATYRDGLRVLIRRRNVDDGLSRKTK
ncbi:cytochrome p450 94c1 [Phtheirospermum japonicum]|uniref:Cytochrome p450 94c1 n=1 Tax=Phtheirospermum japonicum TaxID=374723 RepID=A0A830D2Z9_9LAMI|nr:cytochrome p450 94c1 [Phtheirospermum japonicum]